MEPAIPLPIIYAGLIGVGLSLFVAVAQNQWSLRVFFLLALRLAIGWHFLFEGLYKINTEMVGPTETNRVFTSEPYFKVSPTWMGEYMRKKFDDPAAVIQERVAVLAMQNFAKLSQADQAAACPEAVRNQLDKVAESAEAALKKQEADVASEYESKMAIAKTDASKAYYAEVRDDALKAIDSKRAKLAAISPQSIEVAKANYARWIFGVNGRDTKVKFVSGEAALTAPQRLEHIADLRQELAEAETVLASGMGKLNPIETKAVADLRTDLIAAEADLAKDANAFIGELKKDIVGWDVPEIKVESEGKKLDKFTMWFIAIVGACILFGLCTRISCVLAAGFLVVTYLTHPPFPWYTLPPMTEGNPLFVNKNLIECLALLVLASYPTGRWLGFDAWIGYFLGCGRKKDRSR